MEICEYIYIIFKNIRCFCFFVVFYIDIFVLKIFFLIYWLCFVVLEFNCNDIK